MDNSEMTIEPAVVTRPAEEAPFVPRDKEPQTLVVEVDSTRVKSPYHFRSYPTVRKLGIAMTTIGGALICIGGLTMVEIFKEIYVFYIPGLLVVLCGSFAISATKAKRKKLKKGLVIATVVLSICAISGALYSLGTACSIMIKDQSGTTNILMILRIGVALVASVVAGIILGLTLDSLLCGRRRPGYSTMVRLVCQAEPREMDQLDGVTTLKVQKSVDRPLGNESPRNHGNRSPRLHGHDSPRPHGHHSPRPHRHHTPRPNGDGSPRPHRNHSPGRHGNQSPRPHRDHSPRHHGNESPRPHRNHHGDRSHHHDKQSPHHLSPHHHGDTHDHGREGQGHHHEGHHDHHHQGHRQHHHHDPHEHEYLKTGRKYSGLEHMASMDHSADHKKAHEYHGWDMINKM